MEVWTQKRPPPAEGAHGDNHVLAQNEESKVGHDTRVLHQGNVRLLMEDVLLLAPFYVIRYDKKMDTGNCPLEVLDGLTKVFRGGHVEEPGGDLVGASYMNSDRLYVVLCWKGELYDISGHQDMFGPDDGQGRNVDVFKVLLRLKVLADRQCRCVQGRHVKHAVPLFFVGGQAECVVQNRGIN